MGLNLCFLFADTGGLVQGLSHQFCFYLAPEAQTLCVFLVSLTVCRTYWRAKTEIEP